MEDQRLQQCVDAPYSSTEIDAPSLVHEVCRVSEVWRVMYGTGHLSWMLFCLGVIWTCTCCPRSRCHRQKDVFFYLERHIRGQTGNNDFERDREKSPGSFSIINGWEIGILYGNPGLKYNDFFFDDVK